MSWIYALAAISGLISLGALTVAGIHAWREARCEQEQRHGR